MTNVVIVAATTIKVILTITAIIGPISAACFFIAKLNPRITCLECCEQDWYATATRNLGAIEKQVARLQGQISGIRDEVGDLRSLLL